MDIAVKIIRYPIAVLSSIILIAFWLVLFPVELALVIVTFPLSALFLSKTAVARIYGGFPYCWKNARSNLESVWNWVSSEDKGALGSCGCLLVVGIIAVVVMIVLRENW